MNPLTSGTAEMAARLQGAERRRTIRWGCLAAAAVIMLFANGRDTVPAAAWIAPALFVRYLRQGPRLVSAGLGYAVLVLVWAFQFRGMAPVPGIWYWVLSAGFAIPLFLPFFLDQWFSTRLHGFRATLLLPAAWVSCDYLIIRYSPYGSWGSIAYSQADNLVLLQVVSLVGLTGVTFLIAWTASVTNWIWETGFEFRRLRGGLIAFLVVIAGVVSFGEVRLAQPPSGRTVRIASLSAADIPLFASADVERRAMSGQLSPAELDQVRKNSRLINADLLARSEREAQAGSRLIFWGETNAVALPPGDQELIQRAQELARKKGVYLGLGVAVWHSGAPRPLANELILITPEGKTAWHYRKARPVPPGELRISMPGDGRLRFVDTPFGRVGGAICFDMDFPLLLRQAGRDRVDILIVPSNDWRAIDPWHTQMATYRAIEQGFNLVRQVSHGLSLAVDGRGHRLAAMDHYTSPDRVLVSFVPDRRVPTLYTRIGDLFSLVSLVVLTVLVLLARRGAAVE